MQLMGRIIGVQLYNRCTIGVHSVYVSRTGRTGTVDFDGNGDRIGFYTVWHLSDRAQRYETLLNLHMTAEPGKVRAACTHTHALIRAHTRSHALTRAHTRSHARTDCRAWHGENCVQAHTRTHTRARAHARERT